MFRYFDKSDKNEQELWSWKHDTAGIKSHQDGSKFHYLILLHESTGYQTLITIKQYQSDSDSIVSLSGLNNVCMREVILILYVQSLAIVINTL